MKNNLSFSLLDTAIVNIDRNIDKELETKKNEMSKHVLDLYYIQYLCSYNTPFNLYMFL